MRWLVAASCYKGIFNKGTHFSKTLYRNLNFSSDTFRVCSVDDAISVVQPENIPNHVFYLLSYLAKPKIQPTGFSSCQVLNPRAG